MTTRLVDHAGADTILIHGDNLQVSLYVVVNDENMDNTRNHFKKEIYIPPECLHLVRKYWKYLKDTRNDFFYSKLPINDQAYYLGDKPRLFFMNEQITNAQSGMTTRLVDHAGADTILIHGDNLQVSLYVVVNDENMDNTRNHFKKEIYIPPECLHLVRKYWKYLKDTRNDFFYSKLPINDQAYYLGDKPRLFFMNENTAAILDLWTGYRSFYIKYTRNEFLDHKFHRDYKLHISR